MRAVASEEAGPLAESNFARSLAQVSSCIHKMADIVTLCATARLEKGLWHVRTQQSSRHWQLRHSEVEQKCHLASRFEDYVCLGLAYWFYLRQVARDIIKLASWVSSWCDGADLLCWGATSVFFGLGNLSYQSNVGHPFNLWVSRKRQSTSPVCVPLVHRHPKSPDPESSKHAGSSPA